MNSVSASQPKGNSLSKFYKKTKKMTSRQCWFALSVVVFVMSTITIVLTQAVDIFGNEKLKLVIDTDGGPDDALAIFYLLRAEKYAKLANNTEGPEILGITVVHGNTELDMAIINVLTVLREVDRLDIPVYRGADKSLLITPQGDLHFGNDGFGDVKWSNRPTADLVQSEHAVNALIRLIDDNPGEITLMALGPLTNLALAIRMDKTFSRKINKLFIMGGSYNGYGNIKPGIEFNFYKDPESNFIVLNGTEYKENSVFILGWEAVITTPITNEWRKDVFGNIECKEIYLLNKIERVDNYPNEGFWYFADPLVAAVVLNSTLIQEMSTHSLMPVTDGAFRGGIIVDRNNIIKTYNKLNVIYKVDRDGYVASLMNQFMW